MKLLIGLVLPEPGGPDGARSLEETGSGICKQKSALTCPAVEHFYYKCCFLSKFGIVHLTFRQHVRNNFIKCLDGVLSQDFFTEHLQQVQEGLPILVWGSSAIGSGHKCTRLSHGSDLL